MIAILVVDDHPIVRQGLVAVLEDEPDFQVAGTAGSAEEALALVRRARPDVALLDLELPGMSGLAALAEFAAAAAALRVIIFTAYDTDERVIGAVKAGARGYLLKGATAAEIAQSIRVVHGGGCYLEPRVAARVLAEVAAPPRPAGLSARERDVLRLVAEGLATKEIARTLAISERTVRFHVTSIHTKLGADNRAQAVALAMQQGLL